MKKIDTLVRDIHSVLDGRGGWDTAVATHFDQAVNNLMDARLNPKPRSREGTVRMSNVGQPCGRKLWYHVNGATGTPLTPTTKLKFLYGDIIEEVLLSLAEAAGHEVVGRQDEMRVGTIKGHRDGVIDGMLVDVKSASTYGYKKFKENALKDDDPFGYIPQLAAYLLSSQDDPLVTNKKEAAFLVMDKQHGHICLDVYNLEAEMQQVADIIDSRVEMVDQKDPPPRAFKDKPFQKSGNRMLDTACSYCEYKDTCWPGLRTFYYGRGPVFLTEVKKEPKVKEIPF